MEGTAEPRVLAESSGLHHIALLTSIRERVPCPPLGLRYPEPCGRRRDLLDREWSYCASGSTICPERAGGGQWVLCGYKDLVGREGKEVMDEADVMANVKLQLLGC